MAELIVSPSDLTFIFFRKSENKIVLTNVNKWMYFSNLKFSEFMKNISEKYRNKQFTCFLITNSEVKFCNG